MTTGISAGLTAAEAELRLAEFGPNELTFVRSTPWWLMLGRQFVSPLIGILVVATVVSAVQQHWVDAIAILVILAINSILGFVQERKAESDVHALQSLSTPVCRVLRDGSERVVAGRDVVPDDVVLLESGERIPADLKLIQSNALRIDESMLTGESLAVSKYSSSTLESGDAPTTVLAENPADRLYAGTFVTSGRGVGIVVATGSRTELGAINELVQQPRRESTPLQTLIHGLETRIGIVVLSALVVIFIAGIVLGNDVSTMFRTAVALAVATIPESLPIVLTVALSVGVSRMARRNAIIRTLPSVETLGATTIIGSDKTGTLTQNRLTVERIWTVEGMIDISPEHDDEASESADDVADSPLVRATLCAGALTNEASIADDAPSDPRAAVHHYHGDAVDAAIVRVAILRGAVTEHLRRRPSVAHEPYEPQLACSKTIREDSAGRRVLYVKGSPEAVLALSDSIAWPDGRRPLDIERVHAANEEMGHAGLRVIAMGMGILDEQDEVSAVLAAGAGLTFLGMVGMTDPPRPGVAAAIADCVKAGIQIKMITGDHPVTASAIARRLGLPADKPPITGAEMAELDDHILVARLEQTSVAARVSPQDKLRIVRVLQDAGYVVAVTGDGVNDAPALRAASIGVAMGKSGTDVARESSDLVLTDDNFVTIVHAVEEGRVTFAAIRKTTYFLLSTGFAALVAVSLSVFAGTPLLFLPVQMLWINVVTNGVQDIALAMEPAEGDELTRPPRPRTEGLLSRTLWFRAGITGVWMALLVLLAFIVALRLGSDETHARTFAMTMFVMANFFQVFSSRAEYKSLFQLRLFANKPLVFTAVGAVLLQWVVMSWPVSAGILGLVPLSFGEWMTCIGLGSTVLVIVEAEKLVRRISRRRRARDFRP